MYVFVAGDEEKGLMTVGPMECWGWSRQHTLVYDEHYYSPDIDKLSMIFGSTKKSRKRGT